MYQLVSDHSPEAKIGAVERYDHSPFKKLGEAGYVFRQKGGDDVGLFKIVGGTVDNQGELLFDVMIEFVFQKPIAFFCIICRNLRNLLFLGIKINVEVIGGQNLPIKIGVLNFIPSEIVLPQCRSREQKKKQN